MVPRFCKTAIDGSLMTVGGRTLFPTVNVMYIFLRFLPCRKRIVYQINLKRHLDVLLKISNLVRDKLKKRVVSDDDAKHSILGTEDYFWYSPQSVGGGH